MMNRYIEFEKRSRYWEEIEPEIFYKDGKKNWSRIATPKRSELPIYQAALKIYNKPNILKIDEDGNLWKYGTPDLSKFWKIFNGLKLTWCKE